MSDLYSSISKTLSKQGYNTPSGDIYDLIPAWKSWYRGNVDDFHYYNIKVAGKTKQRERKTMNMAKKTCEDFRKLLWTEKTQISLSNKTATKKLWSILDSKENSFTVNFPNFIEKVFALGTGALVEYTSNGKTLIDYIDADTIVPYKWTNGYISGLMTISTETEEDEKGNSICYRHLTYHEFQSGTYTVKHELYKSDSETELGELIDFNSRFPNIENPFIVQTQFPRFQILKTNITNNFDLSSPMRNINIC